MLHLEVKMKQAKLDWRVFILQFHRNCKNNFFKGNLESEKLLQLFIESEEHVLNQEATYINVTNITNFAWTLKYEK